MREGYRRGTVGRNHSIGPDGAERVVFAGVFHRCGQPYPQTQGGTTDSVRTRCEAPAMVLAVSDQAAAIAVEAGRVYVVGYRSSPHAQDYRDFLERNNVPYQWVDVDAD